MNGGNNNTNYNYNNSYSAYPYGQYPGYYYQQQQQGQQQQQHQQYYEYQHIPQGDPSAALSSINYQYQQQYNQQYYQNPTSQAPTLYQQQQQQTYKYSYPPSYENYYATQDQRSMLHYGDLSSDQQVKVKETPKPQDQELAKPKFCCFRTLKSMQAVAQHEKLHVKCPTCDFMCLPSILHEHEETYHGKAPKESKKPSRPDGTIPLNAPKIDTPEDLAAWIAERKKNWPSKSNVDRKENEMAEKIARGELVPKRKNNNREQRESIKKVKVEQQNNSDSDDVMDPEKDAITSKDPSAMGKILLPEDRPKRKCKYFLMGRCRKGDSCSFSHEAPQKQLKQPRPQNPIRKRPNLLFKLLEKEIQQEKSVILQCLRYIVDNDFFDKVREEDSHSPAKDIADKVGEENQNPVKDTADTIPLVEEN